MFNLNDKYAVKSEYPLITRDYKVLIEDDEDVLFTGKNNFDNRIIGSIIEDDEDNKKLRYFHVITDLETYLKFIKQKISYKEIIKSSNNIFLIERNYKREVEKIYSLEVEEIPEEYLPLENSYCPEIEEKYSLEYIIRLKGQLAEFHKAFVEDLTEVQLGFEKLFLTAVKLLKEFNIQPQIYQEALEPQSIRIGYDIGFDKELFTEEMDLGRYLSSFLEYTLLYFPKDAQILFSESDKTSEEYERFISELNRIYEKAAIQLPDGIRKRINDDFVKGINDIEGISEKIGTSFDEIEILKKFGESEEPIGYINKEYRQDIAKAMEVIEKYTDMMQRDTEAKKYKVFIYHLNTETRNGNAIIFIDNERQKMSKPKIRILGEQALLKTKYTASLHEQIEIEILGKATRIGEQFKYIEIEFED